MHPSFRTSVFLLFLAAAIAPVTLGPTVPGAAARARAVTPQAFTVEPGRARYWILDASRDTVRLYGRFRASGGANDIEVYVLDEDGFENWSNGHGARTYYNSGRVTVGRFDLRLRGGRFYLVFNNKFSVFTNKAVTADVVLD